MSQLKCPFYRRTKDDRIICGVLRSDYFIFQTKEQAIEHKKSFCETMKFFECKMYKQKEK